MELVKKIPLLRHTLITLLLSIIVIGKPQNYFQFGTAEELKNVLTRSFRKQENNQKLNLPPIQKDFEKTYSHPFNFNLTNDGSGNYYFGYNTYQGSGRYEIGELKNIGTDNEIQSVRGQYVDKFSTKDGKIIIRTIGYTADENGFRPFLIDVTVEDVATQQFASPPVAGGPKGAKGGISSAAQAALLGGGLGK